VIPSADVSDVQLIRAGNPGPLTLTGTNTWLLGRGPTWIIDPGPAIEAHVEAVAAAALERGGAGGIALTHDHLDHVEAVELLRDRLGGPPVGAVRHSSADVVLADGDAFGPLRVLATGGHAVDHLAFLAGPVCFSGDAVLGEGSVFIAPDPGSLTTYLAALRALRALALERILPGHGPVIARPGDKLDEYLAHRVERERRLLAALHAGRRTHAELLDAAWGEVPPALRGAARITLAAHLDKLAGEHRLPAGVEGLQCPDSDFDGTRTNESRH
jgi:glyoxylase-like metal-dependent hydrolase (beta-lactamase superfamily II)